MKKSLAITLMTGIALLNLAPSALAGGAAGAVGVHLNDDGFATNIGAAGAIGDGTSFAGVALTSGEVDRTESSATSIDPVMTTSSLDSAEISTAAQTNAVALNTDGDIALEGLIGIGETIDINRSGLDPTLVGDGTVDITAIVDVDVNTNVLFDLGEPEFPIFP